MTTRTLRVTLTTLATVLAVVNTAAAAGTSKGAAPGHMQPAATDTRATIGVNNLKMVVSNVGMFAYDPTGYHGKLDGLYFPYGTTKTVIYAAGLWIGARINGSPRVTLAEYSTEYSPGGMADSTFVPDNGGFRVYKISRGDDAASNPDWAGWPFDDGAPAVKNAAGADSLDDEGNRIPRLYGDQMLWAVYNDANPGRHTHRAGSTAPLGVEVRQSTFAYSRGGALGNSIYLIFQIINKGPNRLDDTYISLWCDPDVGEASDDLVGCDTLLSLGYAYNAGDDPVYGKEVPAVGFDFLQGPVVPSPGDSALRFGRWIHDYRNLPMTSFNKYINGTDPTNSTETYNYMLGLASNGEPVVVPGSDTTTLFQVSGDPVGDSGWVDVNPSDRRFMMSAGPFTMLPGDTQEVVAAVLVGQGADRLGSITDLREKDRQVQAVFDLGFNIPAPPPPPTVRVQPLANRVELIWGDEAEGDIQESSALGQRFVMEGYNVYQGSTIAGPWKRVATFDVINDITKIYQDEFDPNLGAFQRVLVQAGTNSGLANHLTITSDQINGGRLVNHRPYYFAVTAYSYDENNVSEYNLGANLAGHLSETLENRIQGIEVIPNSGALNLLHDVHHSTGRSEGVVTVRILEPENLTGDRYRVSFNEDLTWNLDNLTSGMRLFADQTQAAATFLEPVVEGFMIEVNGPLPGIKRVDWSGSAEAWITGVNWGGEFVGGGLDAGAYFFGSSIQDLCHLVDVELRFSPTNTQKGYRYLRGTSPPYPYSGFGTLPLTAWDITSIPPRQLNVCFVEQYQLASEDNSWLPPDEDRYTGGREYLFVLASDYVDEPDPYYTSRSIYWDAEEFDVLYAWWPVVADGHSNSELADGQVMRVLANRPNVPADTFAFRTSKMSGVVDSVESLSLRDVHPVPNPYYHGTDLESDAFHRQIKFINLPGGEATLEIYNLVGELVRRVEKADPLSSYVVWDVRTSNGLPPASGLYIWRVTAPGLGTKIGKLAVFTEREQLRQF